MTKKAVKTQNTAKAEKVSNTKKKTSKKSASTKVKTKAVKKVEKPIVAEPENLETSETSVVVLETTPKEEVTETETPTTEVVQEVTEPSVIQEEPKNEEEARKLEGAELKEAIENQMNQMKVVTTRSTHGKTQNRMVGKRKFKNPYGHFYGTIGSTIDRMIERGCFTKTQIKTYAGTKMSKVNSHIAHLRRDIGKIVVLDDKKKVKFG
jgi:hypothetical protein